MAEKKPQGLARGLTNYGDAGFSLYLRRSFAKSMGYSGEMLARPVVGIADSKSGFNNCHRHFPELIDAVKRGVLAAGGLPIDFPTVSLGEVFLNPTSMMFRNLMSIDVEEMIRAQPMDAVVLVGGCDKTVPAQLMGAASADLPAVQLLAGPMMPTSFHGGRLGACTDCRRFWAMHRAGKVDEKGIGEVEGNLATTAGTCAVMGTASTMASLAEALGMALPGSAAIPAVHADRLRAAEASGRRAVALAVKPIRPSQIITAGSVANALRVLLAIGGSTNAIVHLTAIARRAGVKVDLAITIDSTTPPSVPPNVAVTYNFYQSTMTDGIPLFRGIPLTAEKQGTEIHNTDLRKDRKDLLVAGTNHINIDKNPLLHDVIVKQVMGTCIPRETWEAAVYARRSMVRGKAGRGRNT